MSQGGLTRIHCFRQPSKPINPCAPLGIKRLEGSWTTSGFTSALRPKITTAATSVKDVKELSVPHQTYWRKAASAAHRKCWFWVVHPHPDKCHWKWYRSWNYWNCACESTVQNTKPSIFAPTKQRIDRVSFQILLSCMPFNNAKDDAAHTGILSKRVDRY